MATRYPTDLPEVPEDRWDATRLDGGGDPDEGTAWVLMEVTADDPEQAERRVLAYIDRDYMDDLRGAVATGTGLGAPGRHRVRIAFARPRY